MTWKRKNREKRDTHYLNSEGAVACNSRDREAMHRAEVEGIATEDPHQVTCRKCLAVLRQLGGRNRIGRE